MAGFEEDKTGVARWAGAGGGGAESVYPLGFSGAGRRRGAEVYLGDPAAQRVAAFFEAKGLAALKEEDRREQWYDDWLAYQSRHGLYAAVLSPAAYSSRGGRFDLLRYARFLEVCAYFSPAHGYSLQVTFLGLMSILMGTSEALKREAVADVEAGKLLAFGVSEREHGSDLLMNEFAIAEAGAGKWVASGRKYYIGNSNAASMIAVLGKKVEARGASGGRVQRMPFLLMALRPAQSAGFREVGKIHTLGVRAAYVGEFEVKGHVLGESDFIAQGREAWDAVFGTVTLGKFFLGFGSIGICEHAWEEAAGHVKKRVLYGKAVVEMPHIKAAAAQAYARLTAMKLYAYRALDYVQAARAEDRRYLLYCAVQKARVSTEGVKVMGLLAECVGAMGFEGQTFFEMALRDIQLIPGLEGSMHVNLGLTAQHMGRYFGRGDAMPAEVPSLLAGEAIPRENGYLMEARTGAMQTIAFGPFLEAYRPLASIANVRVFARQARVLGAMIRSGRLTREEVSDMQISQALGQCMAVIAYGQLVAEQAVRLKIPEAMVSVIFGLLVEDLTGAALRLAAVPRVREAVGARMGGMVRVPRTSGAEWEFVSQRMMGDEAGK